MQRFTFPTYCMSVPVYSSSRKNWFHIQPRLERRSGTPLASWPVSPLRPPVVLRSALRLQPGQLSWTTAHSIIRAQSLLRSITTAAASLKPPRWFASTASWSEDQLASHAAICWGRMRQDSRWAAVSQRLERKHRQTGCYRKTGKKPKLNSDGFKDEIKQKSSSKDKNVSPFLKK